MLLRLFLIFVFVPLADLALLLFLAAQLGWKISLAMVLLTGMLGSWLLRRAYRGLLQRVQAGHELDRPLDLVSDGALVMLGGALLLAPGYLTDLMGISLLVPSSRRWFRVLLSKWLKARFVMGRYGGHYEREDADFSQVVEGTKVNRPQHAAPKNNPLDSKIPAPKAGADSD